MKTIILCIVITLIAINPCNGEADASHSTMAPLPVPGTQKLTSKEMTNYVKAGLRKKLDRFRPTGKVSEEEARVISRLIDDQSTPADCEEAVIRHLRTRYVSSDMDPDRLPRELFSEHGIVERGLAEALFWIKGTPSGLYEYYRLTSLSPLSGQFIADMSGDKTKREMMLRFRLFVMIEHLREEALHHYVFNRPVQFSQSLDEIKSLRDEWGNEEVLREFILNYPFMNGSYVDVRRRYFADPRRPTALPSVEDLLATYCSSVIEIESEKLSFLGKVNEHYGRQCFSGVSRAVMADPNLGVNFFSGLVETAADARGWDVIAAIMERPNGAEIVSTKQAAINQAAKELETELAMIRTIKDASVEQAK